MDQTMEFQTHNSGGGVGGIIVMVVYLAILILVIAGMWKTFAKAGQPGWAAIVPIYNMIVLLKIAGKPAWWFLLFFIPLVGLIIAILTYVSLAKNFGKGTGFAIGLIFLSPIFIPILGFGDAKYQPVAS